MPVQREIRPEHLERACSKRQFREIALRQLRPARAECLAQRGGKKPPPAGVGFGFGRLGLVRPDQHCRRQIHAQHRCIGETLAQARQVGAHAAASVEHAHGRYLDVVEPLAHALRDLARQERDVIERRGATVENSLQTARIVGWTASVGGSWGHDNLLSKSAKYTRSIPATLSQTRQCNGSRRFSGAVARSLSADFYAAAHYLDRTYEATV